MCQLISVCCCLKILPSRQSINPFNSVDLYKSTGTGTDANRVNPDEMAHNEPSHQDPHCLQFYYDFWLWSLFETMVLTRFKDGRSISCSGIKGLMSFHLTSFHILSASGEHHVLLFFQWFLAPQHDFHHKREQHGESFLQPRKKLSNEK